MNRLLKNRPLVGGVVAIAVAVVATVASIVMRTQTPVVAMDPPRFIEEAQAAGLWHVYDRDFTSFVGGGVAVFDCNGDGRQDLYLAGGQNPAALYLNESPVGEALQFRPLLGSATDLEGVTGAYPLDVDGDTRPDLVVLRRGGNVVLRGLGDCRFERANETWGIDGGNAWTLAFSAKWEDASSLPTLAFGNYVDLEAPAQEAESCDQNTLLRPNSSGEGYAPPIALIPGWCTLSMLFSDWDRSGRVDLRMTNDRHFYRDGEEQLWRVASGEPPRLYTREEGWAKLQIWGMGIASQDVTGDGYPEVFLTSLGDNKLQTLADGPAQPAYRDIAIRRGATAHRPFTGGDALPSTAWHPEFQDVNNDGFTDLFIAKGNVERMAEYAARDPSNLLLGQADGTFIESAGEAGILNYGLARGAALADLNLDGMLDLVVVNRRENVRLFRNVGWGDADQPAPMGNWLAIRLQQSSPNRDAIGAWIEVKVGELTIEREVTVGGGHAGGQLGWVHFGLGPAQRAEVRVRWPNGETGPWQGVDGNQFIILERGTSEPQRWPRG